MTQDEDPFEGSNTANTIIKKSVDGEELKSDTNLKDAPTSRFTLLGILKATSSFAVSTLGLLARSLMDLIRWTGSLYPVRVLMSVSFTFMILGFGMSMIDPTGQGNSSDATPSVVNQHFKFEPIGYNYGALSRNMTSLLLHNQPSVAVPKNLFGYGYFSKDVAAYYKTIQFITRYESPRVRDRLADEALQVVNVLGPVEDESVRSKDTQNRPGIAVVLDLSPGLFPSKVGATTFLADAVSFLLGHYRDFQYNSQRKKVRFEVIVRLKSKGGNVSEYGLLVEHLRRLRNEDGITLTVCSDESALSGGYMLATAASPGQLFATPFASIGSIGVIMDEMLNFRPLFDKLGIQSYTFHSGYAKQSFSMFGDVRQEQIEIIQERLDATRDAFRNHVKEMRGPMIKDYDEITSGNYWTGRQALELGLIDRLITSDEYIDERVRNGDKVVKLEKFKSSAWGNWIGSETTDASPSRRHQRALIRLWATLPFPCSAS